MPITKTDVSTLVADWMLSPVKGMYRIHLSGDDLDGYGSQLVTAFATEHICRALRGYAPEEKLPKKYLYRVVNTTGAPADVKGAINDVVDAIINTTDYDTRSDVLSFLVTGIEHFDPEYMFASLASVGHTIQYIVIDHHKVDEGFNKPCDPYREIIWKRPRRHGTTQTVPLRSIWFRDTSQSCTLHLFDAINLSMIQLMKRADIFANVQEETFLKLLDDIRWFGQVCQNISNATMKNWGIWSSNNAYNYSDVSGPAVTQFVWNFYSRLDNGGAAWLDDMTDYVCNFRRDVNDKIFDLIRDSEWNLTRAQFSEFTENVQYEPGMHEGEEILVSLIDWMKDRNWNYRFIDITSRDDGTAPYPAFEMLAQLYLEGNTCVDVLVAYNTNTGYAHLRTVKDEIDLNVVAESFGGGGDPKAIEFIYEEEE